MLSHTRADPPLETLFRPFVTGQLAWPQGGVLFLRARAGGVLHERSWPGLECVQSFKPDADALEQAGLRVTREVATEISRRFEIVLVLPPRQRDEARALLAYAMLAAAEGGRVVVAAANQEGARSLEDDLVALSGPVTTLVKNKCRVAWTQPLSQSSMNARVEEWRRLDDVRPIADGRFLSRPGVFAWDRIDVASALLARHLPSNLRGRAADLGASFGYLSAELLERCPAISALDAYEAEDRALSLARKNLAKYETRVPIRYVWSDVARGLDETYDVIVTNPPFHTGQAAQPQIGRQFIASAAAALGPRGRLWLVANRQLPYESALHEGFAEVRAVAQEHGFKIIEAVKSPRA
jgi:16S rRNA (guanine1207-N2)-methyltransferase